MRRFFVSHQNTSGKEEGHISIVPPSWLRVGLFPQWLGIGESQWLA
jgi:hypothetical protein